MKKVSVNGKEFSKVVLGTNAIYGRSHFSTARDNEYAERCNDDYVKSLIRTCAELGINTIETSANERIVKILSELDLSLQMIGSTRIDQTSRMKSHNEKLSFLLEHKTDVCVIHSQFVDRPGTQNEIKGLRRLVDKIHAQGLLAGISTHRNATVELCEKEAYGIDMYLFPLNNTGFVYPGYEGNETVQSRIELINKVNKPFVLMKALAAGRIAPEEGLQFVLDNSKPNDILSLGMSSIEEAEESIGIIRDYLN